MTRTLIIAAVLTVGTTFAAQAMCNKDQQAMSCAEGTTYDSETHSCLPQTTS